MQRLRAANAALSLLRILSATILSIAENAPYFELLGKTHISDDFVSAHRSEHIPLPVYGNDIIIIRIIRVDFPA